jgi:hypothetical protein
LDGKTFSLYIMGAEVKVLCVFFKNLAIFEKIFFDASERNSGWGDGMRKTNASDL